MVREGALAGVKAAFGMHVWPGLPSGMVASRPGTILAGAIQFQVAVRGRGGHAAIPNGAVDPVVAAAATVGALLTLVSRVTSLFDSAVVSVTRLEAGHAFNVIPDTGGWVGCVVREGWGRSEMGPQEAGGHTHGTEGRPHAVQRLGRWGSTTARSKLAQLLLLPAAAHPRAQLRVCSACLYVWPVQ